MAGLVDALPYIDTDLDSLQDGDDLAQRIDALVQREVQTGPQRLSDDAQAILDRLPTLIPGKDPHSESPLDFSAYALEDPTDPADIAAWDRARAMALSASEYQRGRQANLDLLMRYGGNSFRLSNHLLQHAQLPSQEHLRQASQDRIDRLNARRQASQQEAGSRLDELEAKWSGLVRNVIQISLASQVLQAQIGELVGEEARLRKELDL